MAVTDVKSKPHFTFERKATKIQSFGFDKILWSSTFDDKPVLVYNV